MQRKDSPFRRAFLVLGAAVITVFLPVLSSRAANWTEYRFKPDFAGRQGHFEMPGQTGIRSGNGIQSYWAGGHVLGFSSTGVLIASGAQALKVDFVGTLGVQPVGAGVPKADPDPRRSPSSPEIPSLTEVSYPGLWPGISLKYEGRNGSVVKSTYEIAAGSDPALIRLKSSVPVEIDRSGLLHYRFTTGELIESKPVAWQVIGGRRVSVAVNYRLSGNREIGFSVASHDRSRPLVIDPIMAWNTFIGIGGANEIKASAVAVDSSGAIIIAGQSNGTWGNPILPYGGGGYGALFIAKFDSAGNLLWNTFLCEPTAYRPGRCSLATDGSNAIYLCSTWENLSGGILPKDAFAAKLTAHGSLQWTTYLGGPSADQASGIVVDQAGNAFVVGWSSESWGVPINGWNGVKDAFAARLSSDGAVVWNSFLGGSAEDYGYDIAMDASNHLWIMGESHSSWGAPVRPFIGGSFDLFAAQMNTDGSLQWNTFIGGSDSDYGNRIAVDAAGYAYIAGRSFVSWGAPIRSYGGGGDIFVAKLAPGGALQWNTFLGGTYGEYLPDIALDGMGSLYVVGLSEESWGTPIHPFVGSGGSLGYNCDGFAAKLNADGALQWNTFLGESVFWNYGVFIAFGPAGNAVLAGTSPASWGNPLSPFKGSIDAFFAGVSSSGAISWNTFVGNDGGLQEALGAAADGAGNVYVLGKSGKSWGNPIVPFSGLNYCFVAKWNSAGVLLWNTFIDGGTDIFVKSDGNLLVFGKGTGNYFAATMSPDGIASGKIFLDTISNDWPALSHFAVDPWGNIFGIGSKHVQEGSYAYRYDVKLVKWGPDGKLSWLNTYNVKHNQNQCYRMAVDHSGNVFIAGTSDISWGSPINPFGQNFYEAFVFKTDSNGQMLWNTFVGGGGEGWLTWTGVSGIIVDDSGNCFMSGNSKGAWGNPTQSYEGDHDAYIAKLNPSGELQWNSFTGVGGSAGPIVRDPAGNLLMGGWKSGFMIAKWNADGSFRWIFPMGGQGYSASVAGVAIDPLGDVYLAGNTDTLWGNPIVPFMGQNTAFLAKIVDPPLALTSPNGGENWVAGSTHPITWTSNGSIANVKIEFSSDNGASWTTVVASTPDTGSYPWMVQAVTSGNCLVRVSNAAAGTQADTSDAVFSVAITSPIIGLSKTSLNFGTEQNGTPTPPAAVTVSNPGTGVLNWTAAASADWISVTPAAGTGAGVLTIGIARTDLAAGDYPGSVTVTDPNASNSPATITVFLHVTEEGGDAAPFGVFDRPDDGDTVVSSIPVTGWALDDIGIQSVKIYRGTGLEDRTFIGDATLVNGARPDVEAAYPAYPQNDKAGWGYMLLTNMLPGGGNGPFQLLAYATDTSGHEVLLGSKAITCNNAAAVLPFGAIDTPVQGGTASGSAFLNFGWVLTPQPKSIPVNGTTITVWVDGQPLGHPVYNNYRADIATLFPGYANSNGAVGYFYLNTTGYTDGVHTIVWSVMDSAGATDGIGSRYFTIQNAAGGAPPVGDAVEPPGAVGTDSNVRARQQQTGIRPASDLDQIPEDRQRPLYVKRGFMDDQPAEMVLPDTEGVLKVEMPAVSRIAICLNDDLLRSERENSLENGRVRNPELKSKRNDASGSVGFEAYELVGSELRPLPIGASFDSRNGILYWQPGPGFQGEFRFAVVDKAAGTKKTIVIAIGQ